MAMEHRTGPVGLVLTRQKLPALDPAKARGAAQGAYILEEASAAPRVILIATGSEVHLALAARAVWKRRASPPGWCPCPAGSSSGPQPASYRQEVLPAAVKARVSIEAGVTFGWERWVGEAAPASAWTGSAPRRRRRRCSSSSASPWRTWWRRPSGCSSA